jgi:hypothetical protein
VISSEPDLGDIVESSVFCNLLRGDVAMVIKNGSFFRILMIELGCDLGLKQKLLVHKCFHGLMPP